MKTATAILINTTATGKWYTVHQIFEDGTIEYDIATPMAVSLGLANAIDTLQRVRAELGENYIVGVAVA